MLHLLRAIVLLVYKATLTDDELIAWYNLIYWIILLCNTYIMHKLTNLEKWCYRRTHVPLNMLTTSIAGFFYISLTILYVLVQGHQNAWLVNFFLAFQHSQNPMKCYFFSNVNCYYVILTIYWRCHESCELYRKKLFLGHHCCEKTNSRMTEKLMGGWTPDLCRI